MKTPLPRPLALTSTVKLMSGDNVMVMARCYSIQSKTYLYDIMRKDRTIDQYIPENRFVAVVKPPLNDIRRMETPTPQLGPDVIRGAAAQ